MNKFSKYHILLFSIIVLIIIFVYVLFSYLKNLENVNENNSTILISMETGCGISCHTAKTIEVYSDKTYTIFKGIEEKETTKTDGKIFDDEFSQLKKWITDLPSLDIVKTDNNDVKGPTGADMISTTLVIYDSNGNTKQFSLYDSSEIAHNENVNNIINLLNKLK
jgi:hypothetical protein